MSDIDKNLDGLVGFFDNFIVTGILAGCAIILFSTSAANIAYYTILRKSSQNCGLSSTVINAMIVMNSFMLIVSAFLTVILIIKTIKDLGKKGYFTELKNGWEQMKLDKDDDTVYPKGLTLGSVGRGIYIGEGRSFRCRGDRKTDPFGAPRAVGDRKPQTIVDPFNFDSSRVVVGDDYYTR